MSDFPLLEFKSSKKSITEWFKLFWHDSAYALIDEKNQEIFALSCERITRAKHDAGSILQFFKYEELPKGFLINHSLLLSGLSKWGYLRHFFTYLSYQKIRKILNTLEPNFKRKFYIRKLGLVLFRAPFFWIRLILERLFYFTSRRMMSKIVGYKHHLCHAIAAYHLSPFFNKEVLVFVLDGLWEEEFSSLWCFNKNSHTLISESKTTQFSSLNFTSIGYLYALFTEALWFKMDSDEWKTEALAAYGEADSNLYDLCCKSYQIDEENLKWVTDMNFVNRLHNRKYLQEKVVEIGKENFAATIQKFLEETVVQYLIFVHKKYPIDYICLAWGVVANVIMNLNIYERTPFKNIYILPCFGDDGSALGAAIISGLERDNNLSWINTKTMPYWGPCYSRDEVLEALKNSWEKIYWEDKNISWPEDAAQAISNGKIVAVFHGKMEFGPRALGNRSILANPRDQKIREKMNLSIKRRPYFQPFCPSILESERTRLFSLSYPNKHMTMAFRFREEFRSILPSACHIDWTARPQFVEQQDNESYFRILSELKRITGYGVVVNTSFNLHGRSMVMSPDHAIRDFLDCNLDILFIEWYMVTRKNSL